MTRLFMLLTTLSLTTLSLTTLVACASEPTERPDVVPIAPTPPPADDVSRVSRLALAVQSGATPAAALKGEDVTAEQLDALLYDIAVDPVKSEAYAQALGR